jgi:hypothetical protein
MDLSIDQSLEWHGIDPSNYNAWKGIKMTSKRDKVLEAIKRNVYFSGDDFKIRKHICENTAYMDIAEAILAALDEDEKCKVIWYERGNVTDDEVKRMTSLGYIMVACHNIDRINAASDLSHKLHCKIAECEELKRRLSDKDEKCEHRWELSDKYAGPEICHVCLKCGVAALTEPKPEWEQRLNHYFSVPKEEICSTMISVLSVKGFIRSEFKKMGDEIYWAKTTDLLRPYPSDDYVCGADDMRAAFQRSRDEALRKRGVK